MALIKQKRYEYWTKDGKQWTKWFDVMSESAEEVKLQFKGLRNEYRFIDESEKDKE